MGNRFRVRGQTEGVGAPPASYGRPEHWRVGNHHRDGHHHGFALPALRTRPPALVRPSVAVCVAFPLPPVPPWLALLRGPGLGGSSSRLGRVVVRLHHARQRRRRRPPPPPLTWLALIAVPPLSPRGSRCARVAARRSVTLACSFAASAAFRAAPRSPSRFSPPSLLAFVTLFWLQVVLCPPLFRLKAGHRLMAAIDSPPCLPTSSSSPTHADRRPAAARGLPALQFAQIAHTPRSLRRPLFHIACVLGAVLLLPMAGRACPAAGPSCSSWGMALLPAVLGRRHASATVPLPSRHCLLGWFNKFRAPC